MKKAFILITNITVIALVLFFIILYVTRKSEENNNNVITSYENMTLTAEQIITNYLEDEQHLCDIWANYINRSAQDGAPMTMEQAITFIQKAIVLSDIQGHVIYVDDDSREGMSTSARSTDPNDYTVSYKNIDIFANLSSVSPENGIINLTRAYTNPINGAQSIAFLNFVTLLDSSTGEERDALLMRIEPVKLLSEKLVFLKGEYENVEMSLIDKDGNYIVHGKSLKNSNFFEFYKSYNTVTNKEYNDFVTEITTGTGTMNIKNFKGEDCIISYTSLSSMDVWFLLTYLPASELISDRAFDGILLGTVSAGLLVLLIFNFLTMMSYNRRLAESAKDANQANAAKSYFLSTMSHDIRTPMNAILGLNEMVLRDSEDEKILSYSEDIRTAGNTLLGLINDILDFSKIEAGRMEIINVDYSFVSLLNDLVNMIQKKAEDKGLAFKLDVSKSIPSVLYGDEIRIKQVITNILTNAVKYTKTGSVTFFVDYITIPDTDDIRLKFSVTDTGIGIKEEDLSKLFVAFERIEEKRNRNIEGTGLGITIAQSFLTMMGSHLEVESEYGKGSTFSFDLVQSVRKWDPIGNYEDAFHHSVSERRNYHEKFTAPHAHVLIVDDTPVNLTVFKNLLNRTRIQIDTAESGDECIALCGNKHYDIIFLDHMMPEKDGIETLNEIKELTDSPNASTPVVCLTANAISGMREMYIAAGFDDYITKPIDPDRLEYLLMNYLPKGKIAPASDENENDDYEIPNFIFKIEELDVNSGLTHCGNSESYMSTIRMYLETAEKNARDIEDYWAARDLKNTTVKVHALKSTSRVIGALNLGDFAERLEKAGDTMDIDTLEAELPDLISAYRALARELEPLNDLSETEEEDKPLISPEALKEAYDTLSVFCDSFDYDSVINVIDSLNEYTIPEDEATRYDALKKAVDNFDYDLIPGILSGGME